MLPVFLAAVVLQAACLAEAAAVFAHFMVQNTQQFTIDDWLINIQTAASVGIQAFALNMAAGWDYNDAALALAFSAAQQAQGNDFKLFFSFDYAGNGPWAKQDVIDLIQRYGGGGTYYQYQGKPFVSTFEGPANADDWIDIKAATGCFFIPDWSSEGAGPAVQLGGGVADGLFNWDAWPWGSQNKTTYVDASYIQDLAGKLYMMPVSPWFFTNMPGFDKNWLWNGGDLWYERWKQVWYLQPEFVQIISWNDFGESHYIGPLDSKQYEAFGPGRGDTPFNYVLDMPHDGWRTHLPYVIQTYLEGVSNVNQESAVAWLRPTLSSTCDDGGTTGNTASQLQIEFSPVLVLPNRIYVTALLKEPAALAIVQGQQVLRVSDWDYTPDGGIGLYHASVPVDTFSESAWQLQITRAGASVIEYTVSQGIEASCSDSTNWNAYVASGTGPVGSVVAPPRSLSNMVCVSGYGAGNFDGLCRFTCRYGYCPIGACVCTNLGAQATLPTPQNVDGYPANGDAIYGGLCSFACNYGYCPDSACARTPQPPFIPTASPFLPPACTGGTGVGGFSGLCSYACIYGFCPMHHCNCTSQGALNLPPPVISSAGYSTMGDDADLCNCACSRGYCPAGCAQIASTPTGYTIGDSCQAVNRAQVIGELQVAAGMAQQATDGTAGVPSSRYYAQFFAESLRDEAAFAGELRAIYARAHQVLSGTDPSFQLKINCNFNTEACQDDDDNTIAHTSNQLRRINLCKEWFDSSQAAKLLTKCNEVDYRTAIYSGAVTLLHEITHMDYVMGGTGSEDYAYGFTDCSDLALGDYIRLCLERKDPFELPLCPDEDDPSEEGICPAENSGTNADSLAIAAAGHYFDVQCTMQIPYPSLANVGNDQCSTDARVIDKRDDPVDGYVHFADSYAAGIGTATTTPWYDSCRVGANNYGDLLWQVLSPLTDSFAFYACSGDTVDGVMDQISSWPANTGTTVATLTVGGNDLGFSSIVRYCVLTPDLGVSLHRNRALCEAAENAARALLQDTSSSGLVAKLESVYLAILTKAKRPEFHLYITGYPTFFNQETSDCDRSTFYYWGEAYNTDRADVVVLTQDLRSELNQLVSGLKAAILTAIQAINSQLGSNRVHFVNVVDQFSGHRFCEPGVEDPDLDLASTAFFLSGWKDKTSSDKTSSDSALTDTDAQEAADVASMIAAGPIQLPDAATCADSLGTNPDPYVEAMCIVAQNVAADPNGLEAVRFAQANRDIAAGDVDSTSIPWYLPTRQIKTFHPRTTGMLLYANAIWNALIGIGQL